MQLIRQIPNLLSLTNLFLGCVAILYLSQGKVAFAVYMMLIAAVIDFADGFVARLLNATSELGKQLDSLSDVVTFGVVPGYIMYYLIAASYQQEAHSIGYPVGLFLPGFLLTVFAALRIGKFNIDTGQQYGFRGVPTPAMALFIGSLPMIIFTRQWGITELILNTWLLYGITLAFSLLMVLPIPMIAMKFKSFYWKGNIMRYSFLIVALGLIILFSFGGLMLTILIYIIFSIIYNFSNKDEIQS